MTVNFLTGCVCTITVWDEAGVGDNNRGEQSQRDYSGMIE